VIQVAEHLPSKWKALSSNSSTANNNNNNDQFFLNEKGRGGDGFLIAMKVN
jgi:hypothetical protein